MALYSVFFSTVYFIGGLVSSRRRAGPLLLFLAAGALGAFFSLVQLLPTLELARLSSRAHALPGLAYVGSMLPVGFLTLLYPSWDGFLGSEWYLGLAGLFFALVAVMAKKGSIERFFIFSTGLFLLLALGTYSPLYRLIVETTGFQGFRTPIKFLFFVSFSCAVLAGFGFDRFFESSFSQASKTRLVKKFSAAAGLFLLFPPAASEILRALRGGFLPAFQRLVVDQFFGKAGHPHSAEAYSSRAVQFYDFVVQNLSFASRDTRTAWGLLALFPVILWVIQKNTPSIRPKLIVTIFLFLDLFLYGFTSIRANLEPFSSIDSPVKGTIAEYLVRQPRPFRVAVVSETAGDTIHLPFYPNSNMLYGLDEIGAYSPLVMKEYRDFLDSWGYVNDSISVSLPVSASVLSHLKDIAFLNGRYLISRAPLASTMLEWILSEKGNDLYRLREALPRAFFIPAGMDVTAAGTFPLHKIQPPSIAADNPQKIEISVDAPGAGTLFFSEIDYPGWIATVNGRKVPIQKTAKLFRGIEVSKGQNHILMRYEPVLYQCLGLAALLTFLLLSCLILVNALAEKSRNKRAASC